MGNKIKILIVEDQLIFRSGLRLLLNEIEDAELIGECANGLEFLNSLEKNLPDIVLIDINMPVMDGFEAAKRALDKYPDLKLIVLSTYGEEHQVVSMVELGVKGFLLKNIDEEELQKAILLIHEGKNYFSPELLPSITNSFRKKVVDERRKNEVVEKLSKREIEIIQLIAKGLTNKEIAKVCFISPRTVGGHRTNILDKTGCKNTAGLVSYAITNNLIKL